MKHAIRLTLPQLRALAERLDQVPLSESPVLPEAMRDAYMEVWRVYHAALASRRTGR